MCFEAGSQPDFPGSSAELTPQERTCPSPSPWFTGTIQNHIFKDTGQRENEKKESGRQDRGAMDDTDGSQHR